MGGSLDPLQAVTEALAVDVEPLRGGRPAAVVGQVRLQRLRN